MTESGGKATDAARTAFMERCRSLGLPAWHTAHDGAITHRPESVGPAERLLHSAAFDSLIADTAHRLLDETTPAPLRVAPGCHLVPVIEASGMRRFGCCLVLVLEPEALQDPWFAGMCHEAGIDAAQAAADLRASLPGLAKGVPQDIEQLATMLAWALADLRRQAEDRRSIDEFCHRLMQLYEEVNLVYRLSASMKCLPDPRQMMQTTCDELHDVLPFGWTAAVFADDSCVVPDLVGATVTGGELPIGRGEVRLQSRSLLARPRAQWREIELVRTGPLVWATGCEVVVTPIFLGDAVVGALLAGGKTGPGTEHEVCSAETKMLRASADFLGVFLENAAAFHRQKALFLGTLQALTATIDAKDEYTRGHSERVAMLARQLALAQGMTEAEAQTVHVAGLMHDVGKIGVPEHVLGKAGRLTDSEFDLIKQHPVIGHRILKDIPQLQKVLDGVLYHHERYDGRGYPQGLAGNRIPMLGRLLAVCDTFDAMSSNRSYRHALPRAQVMAELRRSAGTQLDPRFVEAFGRMDLAEYDAALSMHEAVERRAA